MKKPKPKTIKLSKVESETFANLIANPPPPSEKLTAALRRFREPEYVRQEVLFLKEWYKPGCVMKARNVRMAVSPDRIWTLYLEQDEAKPPTLPFKPVHNFNAFLEDYMHDWNWRLVRRKDPSFKCCGGNDEMPQEHCMDCSGFMVGELDYSSRVVDRPVWILMEYKK